MLPYETIFSRVRGQVYDPKELSLDETDLLEIYTERLHSVAGSPRVRRIFSSITFNDEIQQIDYTLKNSVDEQADEDYVVEIFTIGMIIMWLEPQVNSILNTSIMIGGKEEKVLLNNNKTMIDRLDNLQKKLHKMIRDHGLINNSYLTEESTTSS